ncbi:MAG TPA: NAD(P)-binding domain-containing protein [Chloroflexota bacterium]|nr:NAD(P)-binding domain-containing protein [Chloroflexota bacterium]
MTRETVGFIGLGNMGGAIAERIQGGGYGLVVYDIRAEAAEPFVARGSHWYKGP